MNVTEYHALAKPGFAARRAKYGNTPTVVNGTWFASAKEARRYSELLLLERAGEISELRLQVRFSLDVGGVHVCRYIADFTYRDKAGGAVVEDVKGVETPEFKLKRKLMLACHGIDVVTT